MSTSFITHGSDSRFTDNYAIEWWQLCRFTVWIYGNGINQIERNFYVLCDNMSYLFQKRDAVPMWKFVNISMSTSGTQRY